MPRSFVVKNGSKILERWSGGDPRAGILHLLLEPVHEQVELPLGRAQRARHLVERGGEDAELARPGDGHLELELVARDAPGRLHERRDRAHQVVAREHPDGEPEQARRDRRGEERPQPEAGGLVVEPLQGDADVEHAEHLPFRRVRVARRGRARPLVVDRRHDPEHAARPAPEHAAPVGEVEAVERLALRVAGAACLRTPVDRAPDLRPLGREGDPAVRVHHADHLDPALPADVPHHEVPAPAWGCAGPRAAIGRAATLIAPGILRTLARLT